MGRVLLVEAIVCGADRNGLRLVEAPDRVQRSIELRTRAAVSLSEPSADHLDAVERVTQAHEIQLSKLGELRVEQPLGVGVIGVTLEHVKAAAVEVEIARASSQAPVDIGVVAFTLFPTGGHQRNRAVDAKCRDLRGKVSAVQ